MKANWKVIFCVLFASFILKMFYSDHSSRSSDTGLVKLAIELSEDCPRMIDPNTRLDNISSGHKMVIYNHIFVSSLLLSKNDLNVLKTKVFPSEINRMCSNDGLKPIFKDGVSLKYIYRYNSGDIATSFTVTPKDCGY